jgi:hypothetical protein
MTDHPLLIPTSEGPVGGVVSEPPDGEHRAALILLSGHGSPARAGINSFWARTARSFAELGIVVLRIDYSREGETLPIGEGVRGQIARRELELRLLDQIVPWFHERVPGVPRYLVGSCSGARLSIDLLGRFPDSFAGAFLSVPYLQTLFESGGEPDSVDPLVVECLKGSLDRTLVWILVGENDLCDIPRLIDLLGPDSGLEVEVAPRMALHFADQPDIQEELHSRLTARISSALTTPLPFRSLRATHFDMHEAPL